jgi:peptide/nickel transport system permease protein
VLPVFTLCTYYTGLPLLLMRNNLLEVLSENYIDTARAKGLTNRRILLVHAARNAILPVVTAFAIAIGFAVGGQVLIEQVFSWPGLGREMVQAALRSDYPVAQGAFALLSFIVITMNFVADLAYTYLDPRVRLGES